MTILNKTIRLARRVLSLIYIGLRLNVFYIPVMVLFSLSAALWFVLIVGPTTLLAQDRARALLMFLPGLLTTIVVSCGMHESTEFLRLYVRQGIFDMFRECGLGVLHYLIANVLLDILVIGIPSYVAASLLVLSYAKLGVTVLVPKSWTLLMLGLAALTLSHILFGMLVACLYTYTAISEMWLGILEACVAMCSLIPPTVFPVPEIGLVIPVTLVTEILRAAYGTDTLPVHLLLPSLVPSLILQAMLALALSRLCERHIAKHGVPLKW